MNRVPHCSECDRCKYTQMPRSNTKEYKNTNTIAKNSESQVPAQKRIRLKPSKMIKGKLNSKGIEENE